LQTFAIEIQTSALSDLREDTVQTQLKKAMGANYDRYVLTGGAPGTSAIFIDSFEPFAPDLTSDFL
jgi:hypothetical protein